MAILLSKDIPHGPVEVLITATEETGMDGANGIRHNWLKGDILLNLTLKQKANCMLVAPEVLMEKSHSITHLKLFQQD